MSASGEPASSIETETLAPAREAKTEAAPDAPDFQAPAPAAATAHAAAPAAHAAPVRATSETVANLSPAQLDLILDRRKAVTARLSGTELAGEGLPHDELGLVNFVTTDMHAPLVAE